MSDALKKSARDTLIVGLRNAHGVERQAITVLEPQLGRLGDYPDLRDRLATHVEESRVQMERLERALERLDASPSTVKDAVLSVMGLAQSSVQAFADDAVLKATMANTMLEHFEIAAYRSMIELTRIADLPDLRPDLEASLREEEAMAEWLERNLESVTRRYVALDAGLDPFAVESELEGRVPGSAAAASGTFDADGSLSAGGGGFVPEADAGGVGASAAGSDAWSGQGFPAAETAEGSAEPEAPLRDLGEFTEADAKPDAWPTGAETATERDRNPVGGS